MSAAIENTPAVLLYELYTRLAVIDLALELEKECEPDPALTNYLYTRAHIARRGIWDRLDDLATAIGHDRYQFDLSEQTKWEIQKRF